jgi:threonine/homoserine/homoserine lactone efflux protein
MIVDPATLFAFAAASTLLALAPGPDNIFVLAQSAMKGSAAGLMVTLGLCTGLIVHTSAVALGVAALVATSAVAFAVLKYAGAAYLAWLAWKAFRAGAEPLGASADAPADPRRMYLRGIAMNVTNPKVAIFFLAFLPQFVSPERGSPAAQIFLLGAVFMLCSFVCFSAIALAADRLSGWLRRSARGQVMLNRAAGAIFLGLAAKLALAQR